MHRKMPALQKEMQASSTSNFRYFTCLLDKGHIISGCYFITITQRMENKIMYEVVDQNRRILFASKADADNYVDYMRQMT